MLSFSSCDISPLFFLFCYLYILNRYEEVEVRKKLEEKEKQDEKKRKEDVSMKDGSPKASAASRKDSKKVTILKKKTGAGIFTTHNT